MRLNDILDELHALGVSVEPARDLPEGTWACYDKKRATVFHDWRVTARHMPYVLLHELLHVRRGDDGMQPGRVERMIDREVALTLICARDFITASKLHGGHMGAIAAELDAPVWAVEAFADHMRRRTYR